MKKDESVGVIVWVAQSVMLFMLFIVFLVLKLCGVISWSWWLVTLPLWAFSAVAIVFFAVVLVIFGIWLIFDKIKRKRRIKAIQRGQENGK